MITESVGSPCSAGAKVHGGFTLSLIMRGPWGETGWRLGLVPAIMATAPRLPTGDNVAAEANPARRVASSRSRGGKPVIAESVGSPCTFRRAPHTFGDHGLRRRIAGAPAAVRGRHSTASNRPTGSRPSTRAHPSPITGLERGICDCATHVARGGEAPEAACRERRGSATMHRFARLLPAGRSCHAWHSHRTRRRRPAGHNA